MNEILSILNKYDIRPNKRLGQNFLIDLNIAGKIVSEAGIDKDTTALEIGGGVGSLTGPLLKAAKKVIVVELDKKMCDILNAEYGRGLTVINADILKTEISAVIRGEQKVSVCANLPYYITTPIIMGFLERREHEDLSSIKSLTFMMQKEVADRVLAKAGTKDYGAITPVINYYCDARLVASVPPGCFVPAPAVHSSVVRFDILREKRVSPKNERLMFNVIKASFGQRRKTLLNALNNLLLPSVGISKGQLEECFDFCGIRRDVRGETLELSEFSKLSDAINELRT